MYQHGDKIGRWSIKVPIGKGISETYLVVSREDKKQTTGILKRYVKHGSDDKRGKLMTTSIALKQKEILETLSGIKGIPQVHEFIPGEDEDILVLEYMPGENLKVLLGRDGFDELEAVNIAIKIAEIIKEIHGKNVIHNDIKPSNIVVDSQNNSVAIIDFESATIIGKTREDIAMGTVVFAAPEYRVTKRGSIASDIYSFGRLFSYLLEGNNRDKNGRCIIPMELKQEFNEHTYRIVEKCSAPDPNNRFANFGEIIKSLSSLRSGLIQKQKGSGNQHRHLGKIKIDSMDSHTVKNSEEKTVWSSSASMIGNIGNTEFDEKGNSAQHYQKHSAMIKPSRGGFAEAIGRTVIIGIACVCLFLIIFLIGRYLGFDWIILTMTDRVTSLRKNQSLWTSLLLTLMIFTIRVVVRHSDSMTSKLLNSAIEFPMDVLGVLIGYVGALFQINTVKVNDALTYLIVLIIMTLITCYLCYYNEEIVKEENINKVKLVLFMFPSYVIPLWLLNMFTTIG